MKYYTAIKNYVVALYLLTWKGVHDILCKVIKQQNNIFLH